MHFIALPLKEKNPWPKTMYEFLKKLSLRLGCSNLARFVNFDC